MIELLILYILYDEKCSIYSIGQKIEKLMRLFLKVSFGTIHPALKRLEQSKYISVKSELSSGGQRRSTYSITEKGRDYFAFLMTQDLPENPSLAAQTINIKLMFLSKIKPESRNLVIKSALQFYETQKAKANNILEEQNDTLDELQKKYIKQLIKHLSYDIELINQLY